MSHAKEFFDSQEVDTSLKAFIDALRKDMDDLVHGEDSPLPPLAKYSYNSALAHVYTILRGIHPREEVTKEQP